MKKLSLHWFCTQNHILEPFSVRRACTQCYVTSEPYPQPSQIWCKNVRETRKKIVIKCRGESFARCRVIARYVEGGGGPSWPPSLFRVKFVVNGTSLASISILLALNWQYKVSFINVKMPSRILSCIEGIDKSLIHSNFEQKQCEQDLYSYRNKMTVSLKKKISYIVIVLFNIFLAN